MKKRMLTYAVILALFILIEPGYFVEIKLLHICINILKSLVALSVIFFFAYRRIAINKITWGICIYEIVLLFSTLMNSLSLRTWFAEGAYVIILALLMQIVIDVDSKILLKALVVVLGCYVHINLVSRLLFPSGLYTSGSGYTNCWFLGLDNLSGAISVTACVIALYRMFTYRKIILWDLSVIISGIAFPVMNEIATTLIGMALMLLFLLVVRIMPLMRKIATGKTVVTGGLVLFIFIQFFNIQSQFSQIFGILGKSSTLSNRTLLWLMAWKDLLSKNIIYGFGVFSSQEYAEHFRIWWALQMHNYYLHVIYSGGLIAFSIFVYLLYAAAKRFDTVQRSYNTSILLGGFLAMLVMYQTESYRALMFFLAIYLFLLYYSREFSQLSNSRKQHTLKYSFSKSYIVHIQAQ